MLLTDDFSIRNVVSDESVETATIYRNNVFGFYHLLIRHHKQHKKVST